MQVTETVWHIFAEEEPTHEGFMFPVETLCGLKGRGAVSLSPRGLKSRGLLVDGYDEKKTWCPVCLSLSEGKPLSSSVQVVPAK